MTFGESEKKFYKDLANRKAAGQIKESYEAASRLTQYK